MRAMSVSSINTTKLSKCVGMDYWELPEELRQMVAETWDNKVVRMKVPTEWKDSGPYNNSYSAKVTGVNTEVPSGWAAVPGDWIFSWHQSAYPARIMGSWAMPDTGKPDVEIVNALLGNDKKEETNKMKTFKFTINGKQFMVQDEVQFIGLARVREVAQVFPGTKLFVRGKEVGELKRVKVGHFHLFPSADASMGYEFFTKGAQA